MSMQYWAMVALLFLTGCVAVRLHYAMDAWGDAPDECRSKDVVVALYIFGFGSFFLYLIWPAKILMFCIHRLLCRNDKTPLREWFAGGI